MDRPNSLSQQRMFTKKVFLTFSVSTKGICVSRTEITPSSAEFVSLSKNKTHKMLIKHRYFMVVVKVRNNGSDNKLVIYAYVIENMSIWSKVNSNHNLFGTHIYILFQFCLNDRFLFWIRAFQETMIDRCHHRVASSLRPGSITAGRQGCTNGDKQDKHTWIFQSYDWLYEIAK